jgi:MFS family permease
MPSAPTARLPWYRLAGLTLFALAFGIGANTLEPALLGQRVLELAPEHKNTALGLTTAAGLLVATLVQPLVGGLSDRTVGPLGRRVPYFIAGAALASSALLGVVWAPTVLLLGLGVLVYQFGSNTAQAPWQALLPDQVPAAQRGTAAGLKSLFEVLGFVLGRTLSGYLVAADQSLASVICAGAAFWGALALTWLAARGEGQATDRRERVSRGADWPSGGRGPTGPPAASQDPLRSGAEGRSESAYVGLRTALAANPSFAWWFAQRGLFWCGLIALNTFMLYYLMDVVGMEFAQASRFVGQLSLVLGVGVLALSIPAGRLADRLGRRPLVLAAGLLAAAGTGLILVARTEALLFLAGAILGVAVGAWQSANWALVTDLVPAGHAARYLGLANIATAGGSLLGRSAGALLVDPLNRLTGSRSLGYLGLYGLTLGMFLLSAWAVRRIPSSPPEPSIEV